MIYALFIAMSDPRRRRRRRVGDVVVIVSIVAAVVVCPAVVGLSPLLNTLTFWSFSTALSKLRNLLLSNVFLQPI